MTVFGVASENIKEQRLSMLNFTSLFVAGFLTFVYTHCLLLQAD
jgi:hypothetical protein